MRKTMPCSRCGEMMWRSKKSTTSPVCHPCRRARPEPSKHKVDVPCARCGTLLTQRQKAAKQRFCSMSCAKRAEPSGPAVRLPDAERRARARIRDVVKRTRKANVTIESVDPVYIYERDKWRCHLCGGQVDRLLSGNDRMGPTLDHVVPLSKGGEHSNANVALAHRICNIRKGDRAVGEQLAIVG